MKQFADVILPLPLQPLTYHIPAIYQNKVEIGSGVLVPFRSGKLLLGIVVRCHTTIPTYSTKDLLSVLYTKPVFTPEQLTFLTWLSDYYLTNLGTTLSLAWPKLLHFPHNILFQINGKIEDHRFSAKRAYEISTTQHAIQTALQYQPLTYASIMQLIDQKEASKSLIVLLSKRLVEAIVTTSIEPIRLTPSIFTQPLQPLAILTPFQKNALSAIEIEFTQKTAVLLHGAIGSGKTELYMHLIASALSQQKQVLLLAPEIGLVTHIVERIRPLWGEWLVVYHSKQSHKERLKTWFRLLDPSPLLVVGTRSALLLPFKVLQLIIIDEEHDHAYKQTDAMPTYHARDSSMLLAQQHQANVLLGSGTPSIESYYNAKSGKYGLVLLGHRFGSASSPRLFFIDLNIEKKRKAMRDHFSLTLLSKLEKNHREGGQAMIFQNRRGYAQYFLCAACGWIPRCLTCWVSLTYHQSANQLRCHYCDYATPPLQSCQDCGSEQLHNIGFGTEKVEEGLELIFPGKKIGRMDLDSTKGKFSYQSILKEVTTGSIDILVGTQMMAKGLDFPNIRLIGILDIDSMLYFPDFRSNEKCFQLITQLAGRAGRRNAQGSVFIQTRQTHHPLFQYLASGDYEGMYTAELAERKRFLYPPYVRLVRLSLRCIDADTVRSAAMALKQRLEKQFEGMVLGPQQPLVGKIRNHFLLDIFLKIPSKNAATLQKTKDSLKRSCQQALTSYKKVKILWDVDPI